MYRADDGDASPRGEDGGVVGSEEGAACAVGVRGTDGRRRRRRGDSEDGIGVGVVEFGGDGSSAGRGGGDGRKRRAECPVPKPGGILGEWLGFHSGGGKER